MAIQIKFCVITLFILVLACFLSHAEWPYKPSELKRVLKDELGFKVGETKSSLHTLKNFTFWAAKEEEIVQVLSERLQHLQLEVDLIQSYLEDYKETSGKAFENSHKPRHTAEERGKVIGSHFVFGHRMICRYNSFITKLRNLLQSTEYNDNKNQVNQTLELTFETEVEKESEYNILTETDPNSIEEEELHYEDSYFGTEFFKSLENTDVPIIGGYLLWPNWVDKYYSMLGILHIQHVYGIAANKLRIGLTVDSSFGGELNALNCYEIGTFALYRSYYYAAIEWLEEAKRLVFQMGDTSLNLDVVSELLSAAIRQHNTHIDTHEQTDYFYSDYTFEGHTRRTRTLKIIHEMHLQHPHPMGQYVGLCAGITFQSPAVQKNLKCFYTRHHPYLYINPLKAEKLSESPPTFQFYEMLGNKLIEKIKAVGDPILKPSGTEGYKGGLDVDTEHRTSVGAFLYYHQLPELYKFAEIVTNLTISAMPEFAQFVEYTYGRQYSYHLDAMVTLDKDHVDAFGDRMATLLYFVENPEAGGRTPFCDAGIYAHQVRGSAVLWYGMYRNGTVRTDGIHGACPIIHGHKMIINHWVRYKANFRNFQCSLNQFE